MKDAWRVRKRSKEKEAHGKFSRRLSGENRGSLDIDLALCIAT